MTIIQAIILGIVQGLTEFLPVSSSAHLVLVPPLINVNYANPSQAVAFDTLLHLGTLLAVIAYFWKDIIHIITGFFSSIWDIFRGKFRTGLREDPSKRLVWLLVIGTIPAALTGILLNKQFEALFNNYVAVGFFLLITGVLLWAAERVKTGHKEIKEVSFKNALSIGIFQAFAIAPGISRSGSTIAAGLFSGLERELAARYSFLLAIPTIAGAALVQVKDIGTGLEANTAALVSGFLAALIVGFLAIKLLLKLIKERTLMIFAYYCWIVGAVTLIISHLYGLI
ncbi:MULTISPECIES: undecaprenyl-diphosphatase UppP [Methanobacterium]|uniref:Undecaprenyl-diphosphatase n=1 Tax=Methanobacterium bryantii TaxID=2161 RepID=A0A2A2H656_METBR|nr:MULTISPECIES: undecaprenyl-diphosphatase UppP [Methanobacterium]OEC84515.1 undecaprenyl-diphosphatase UppP [Methanobacterium sp. A39]PAV04815.1 UDP pyrophosphate phosphatase [Methanobacterium bryantii]